MAAKNSSGKGGSKGSTKGGLVGALGFSLYKPSQGRRVRQWTAVAAGLVVLFGVKRLYDVMMDAPPLVRYGLPAVLIPVAGVLIFRLVNYVRFADFLIATEAELNKVSWSSKSELKNATVVVLTTVVLMAVYLFAMDRMWEELLKLVGVLQPPQSSPSAALWPGWDLLSLVWVRCATLLSWAVGL